MLKNRKYKTMKGGGVNPFMDMSKMLVSIDSYVNYRFNKNNPKLTSEELTDEDFKKNLEGLYTWLTKNELSYEYLWRKQSAAVELVKYLVFFYNRYYSAFEKTHNPNELKDMLLPEDFENMLLKLYKNDPIDETKLPNLFKSYRLLNRGIQHSLSEQEAENRNSTQYANV